MGLSSATKVLMVASLSMLILEEKFLWFHVYLNGLSGIHVGKETHVPMRKMASSLFCRFPVWRSLFLDSS